MGEREAGAGKRMVAAGCSSSCHSDGVGIVAHSQSGIWRTTRRPTMRSAYLRELKAGQSAGCDGC